MARRYQAASQIDAPPNSENPPSTRFGESPITTSEFLSEMVLGIPRGGSRMVQDAVDHPFVVGGTIGAVLAAAAWLPNPWAKVFSRGLMYLGGGISAYFMVKGTVNGVEAWNRNDRAALRLASTEFGVGTLSMAMAVGGYKIAQRLGSTPEKAQRWLLIGNLLHSSDEIAATLAILRGASTVK